uniref:Uncharacterized protein n=1 Tax=Amphora coffeiformis TaxID=265554 RepID=A0A7S3LJH1_9STRA
MVFHTRPEGPIIVRIVDKPVGEGGVVRRSSEASINSTFTAERVSTKPQAVPFKKTLSVSFDLEQTVKYESPAIGDAEMKERWFGRFDYKMFKHEFIETGRKLQNDDELDTNQLSFKNMLLKSFEACCNAADDVFSCLLDEDDEKVLRELLANGTRRGLIRVSNLSIFIDKATRRKQLNKAVLATQELCQFQNFWDRAESIRRASQEISRPSRLFAWRIAY